MSAQMKCRNASLGYEGNIVTEDLNYHIDTINNEDGQKEAMIAMTEEYINMDPQDYAKWEQEIHSVIKENRAKEK